MDKRKPAQAKLAWVGHPAFLLFFAMAIMLIWTMASPMDAFVRAAQIAQALLTPAIAVWIGVITSRIQRQQAGIQQQQARTHHLQYRLALMERRMKVFNASQEFIASVVRDASIGNLEPLFKLARDTSEHRFLFGVEISEFIDALYSNGNRLRAIDQRSGPQKIIRPEDIEPETEILTWFVGQTAVAQEKFLKYIDFREP